MQPERWRRIEALYHAAREHERDSRNSFLAAACGSDDQLRRQVQVLLDQDTAREGVLDRPADDLLKGQTQTAFTFGTQLGPYRLEALLGEGGMGEVFRAVDTRLNRRVAIKICSESIEGRFAREARAIAALNHPHICTLHDVGPNYLVMELIEGETLCDRLCKGPLPIPLALHYAVQIAGAVTAAHERGIVHRDLKPGNIMINQSGVKVLDFGLVKLLHPSPSSPGNSMAGWPQTETGVVLGTAAYMSPEQAEGRDLDVRSDIFSFGVVLYEMATGRQPFAAESRLSVLSRIVNDDPAPPSQLSAIVPRDLENIIMRCLRKDPRHRYQMMADVKIAIEDLDVDLAAGKPARGRTARWRRWALPALLPLLLILSYLAWRGGRGPQQIAPPQPAALTTLPGAELYPSLSPDGNQVAFSWNGPNQDNPDIYVQMIGGEGTPHRLTTHPANDYNPVWSPDGRWIAFLRTKNETPLLAPTGRNELRLVPSLGGPERLLGETVIREQFVTAPRLAWCPNGTSLVVTDSPGEGQPDALFLVSVETGEKRQLTHPPHPVAGDSNPAIAPDGRSMVFRRNISFITGELYWLALGEASAPKGQPRQLTRTTLDAGFPAWMPDGKEILFSARHGLWRLAPEGGNQPERLPFVGEDGIMPVVSRLLTGAKPRLVYVRNLRDLNIWRLQPSAPGSGAWRAQLAPVISSTKPDSFPQFSPDGRRIAFESDRSGPGEVWLAEADGSNAYSLTAMGASDTGSPRWSPDGKRITFDSNLEGHYEVYVISAEGGQPRRITSHTSNSNLPVFSRDGRSLYFSSNRGGDFQIWKTPLSGEGAIQMTHNGGYGCWESPEGAYLYYIRYGTLELWRLPVTGGQPAKVLDDVVGRGVVVLQEGIYYLQRQSVEVQLRFFDVASGTSRTLARNLGQTVPGLTVSPDRRTILYARVDSTDSDLMLVENFR